jgi:hypothetical protein
MHSMHAPVIHLLKDRFGPVGILQVIYQYFHDASFDANPANTQISLRRLMSENGQIQLPKYRASLV